MTIYIFIILAVCLLDQATKMLVPELIAAANNVALSDIREGMNIKVVENVLHLTYKENAGMSFGWLQDDRWVFMILSTVGIAAMLAYLIYLKGNGKLTCFSLALIVGGGIGNMFDRISLGYVIDFIDVKFIPHWVWIFNVADSAVCVGAALLILSVILDYKKEKSK